MQFQVPINIPLLQPSIEYKDPILLTGSCFTEHIGNYLKNVKFTVLQNPNGILFDPLSVCHSLNSYIENKQYSEEDLFYLNECWHSRQHHSRFSNIDKEACLNNINISQNEAHRFLKKANWLIVTLGSSFAYRLVEGGTFVANCHKAPAQTFNKHLCTIEEIITAFEKMLHKLFDFNPDIRLLLTISPVRHLRDGVTENNRSKARLIEAVHYLVNTYDALHYFPAYELVIDVLRDYRFYDIDMAHPNYAATQFVLEKFAETCMNKETQELMETIKKIVTASNHKPFNPHSQQHKNFLKNFLQQTQALQNQYPHLNFEEEISYFGNG
jgi:hypothetical protein